MARDWPTSRLLALPQELRTRIYEELLCPEPAKVHTLWHDREGRQGSFDLHPSILRVNKQIYFEASSLLYDSNIFEIDLTTKVNQHENNYKDGKPDPAPLFQRDAISAVPLSDEPLAENTRPSMREAMRAIHAHSFQRLRHIRLRTRTSAIWGFTTRIPPGKFYFSHTGHLVMRVLQILAEQHDVVTSAEQTFGFIVVPDFLTRDGIFGVQRSDAKYVADVIEMLKLLVETTKKRSVFVEEYIRPTEEGGYPPLEKVEVDVNARLAQLREWTAPRDRAV